MRLSALILTVLLPCAALLGQSGATIDPEIKVSKIWDQGGHNAFTDLLRFSNYFYCSFREGTAHSPGTGGNNQRTDGLVRIIRSRDGVHWESVALMAKDSLDLRDPKMSVTPDGRIMVNIGGSVYRNGKLMERYPQVSFSDRNGLHFSAPQPAVIDPSIVSHGDWIWRVTWHKGIGYATDYQIGPLERKGPTSFYILTTRDGIHYEKLAKSDLDGFPNEATIRFDNKDSMFILIRRELADTVGVLARTAPPYTDWQMKKLDFRLGGPNFIFTPGQKIILGTRARGPVTAVFWGDKSGYFREILQLPSGGDNSYPGLLLGKDTLWVSYYSSHEGKASIYLARIPLSYINRMTAAPPILPAIKIWDKAPHSAFTDIVRFKNKFYCTFREGSQHMPSMDSADGKIRVIVSDNGETWQSAALLDEMDIDLRDPKFSIMPDNRLIITCGGSDYHDGGLKEWHTRVAFSGDGVNWTKPKRVAGIPLNNWFFRLTWLGDTGYVAANVCGDDPVTGNVLQRDRRLIIYKTTDGLNYRQVSDDIAPSPMACEATIRFGTDDDMFIIMRNSNGISPRGTLAVGRPPYTTFSMKDIWHGMGGQNMIRLKNGRWLVATREYPFERPDQRKRSVPLNQATVLLEMNDNGILTPMYELPSDGDTGYPGLLTYDDRLWVSYYSSHENKTAIYLSTVPLKALE